MSIRLLTTVALLLPVLLASCRRRQQVNLPPDVPTVPSGPAGGHADSILTYATTTSDPEGRPVSVRFSWGDGETSDWTESRLDGTTLEDSHAWTWNGEFEITAQARDEDGVMSDWSGAASLAITGAADFHYEIVDSIPIEALTVFAEHPSGEFVYAGDDWEGNLYVINTTTREVVDTVDLGCSATNDIVVSPDGAFVYVSDGYEEHGVSVVRTSDNVHVADIDVDGYPEGLAITPDGQYLYVACEDADSVAVVRTDSNEVIDKIAVVGGPTALAMSPDGSELYVVSGAIGMVSVVRTSDNTVVDEIHCLFDECTEAAVTPDGRYLLVPDAWEFLHIIDVEDGSVAAELWVGYGPVRLAVDPAGRFAYSTVEEDDAWVVVSLTDLAVRAHIAILDEWPNGVLCLADGRTVYLAAYDACCFVAEVAAEDRGDE